MNRIQKKLQEDKKIVSIYFTAGFPNIDDTVSIITELEKNGVDMIEIGLPFSDPLADGPTIQASSTRAIENGMTANLLFQQLQDIRKTVSIPLLIMGYFNPILQFGVEEFCKNCAAVGIDGLIIPDLPPAIYESEYQSLFETYNLKNIFLITPQTSEERIRKMDEISDNFLYMVSASSVTGNTTKVSNQSEAYFKRIHAMQLQNPQIIGFGISNSESFQLATKYQKGAIIGTAFIQFLENHSLETTNQFLKPFLQ